MSTVKLTTSKGNITIQLDPEQAPISTANFLSYVDSGFYDGTIFHRVIDGFMIQGGGFTPDMKQKKATGTIKNEWRNDLNNTKGTIAMARLGGDPDSASCQFFINVNDNDFLDRPQPDGAAYAVFGKVTDGMDVVNAIKGVKTTTKAGHGDVPLEAIVITKAERLDS
jgi:peptidyl-prolyl cis-trans isomerase B (cyclophilin B)